LLSNICNVSYPEVRKAVSDYIGGQSFIDLSFDTRLIRLNVYGRIMSLGFSEMSQMLAAIEWFVHNKDYFLAVCSGTCDTVLLEHSLFCHDGLLFPPNLPQERPNHCVPIVRVDFVRVVGSRTAGGGSWLKRDRYLSLMFTDDNEIANMH